MKFYKKAKGLCATVAIITVILLAIIVLCGIWIEDMGALYWRLLGSGFVILALSAALHAFLQGLED